MLKGFRFIGSPRVGVHKLEALAEREIFHGRPQLMLIYLYGGECIDWCLSLFVDDVNASCLCKDPSARKQNSSAHLA